MMDFPLQHAVSLALREEGDGSLMKIYDCLAHDFQYPDPQNLVIFPDNHDITRFLVQVNNDPELFKMGITLFLTTRGIPQLYYGTEILMGHTGTHDSEYRKDFPGGWENDAKDGFTGTGLTVQEKEMQDYIRKLLVWRKGKEVIHSGKLVHFLPFNGFYVFFRINEKEKMMIVLNKNAKQTRLELGRLAEMFRGAVSVKNLLTGENYNDLTNLVLPPRSVSIFGIN
jgi:glycosidase